MTAGDNLTVKDVADRLGVSRASVYNLCHTGQLAHLRIGTGRGVIRVPTDSLTAFIAKCMTGSERPAESVNDA